MKPHDKTDTARFSKALATLRQKVDAVLERVPDLMAIDRLEETPGGQSKSIEDDLWGILLYGEYYVAKVKADLNVALRTVKGRGKNYAFYEREYPAFIDKARKLIGASNLPSTESFERGFVEEFSWYDDEYPEFVWDERTLDEYERYVARYVLDGMKARNLAGRANDPLLEGDAKIKDSFALAVEAVEYVANCHRFIYKHCGKFEGADTDIPELVLRKEIIDENTRKDLGFHRQDCFDFDPPEPFAYQKVMQNCNLVAQRFWFNPDAWLANERAISPVIVARERVPKPVKSRIDEIYLSLVFGNWMSAIALSRCLLEYVLLDFLPKKGQCDENGKQKALRDLSSSAAETLTAGKRNFDIAEWKANVGKVIANGNHVMHPEPPKPLKNNIFEFRLIDLNNETKAKESFKAVSHIVTVLYDARFRKG